MIAHRKSRIKTTLATVSLIASISAFGIAQHGLTANLTETKLPWMVSLIESAQLMDVVRDYDVAILVDTSGSMAQDLKRDSLDPAATLEDSTCRKKKISRWKSCMKRIEDLAVHTHLLKRGLRLTAFGHKTINFNEVSPNLVSQVLADSKPQGGTFCARALNDELNRYFHRRKANPQAKPLLVAIVTDGAFDDKLSFRQALVKATKKMQRKNEITVGILKIGEEPKARKFLDDVDNHLKDAHSARFDIVQVKQFDETNELGVGGAIAQLVNQKQAL